jgi:hypothetical protein
VKQFTQRVYGLPSSEFFGIHEQLLHKLRSLLVPDQIQQHAYKLVELALPHILQWQQQGEVSSRSKGSQGEAAVVPKVTDRVGEARWGR